MSTLPSQLLPEDRIKLELFPVKYNGQHQDHLFEGKLVVSRLISSILTDSHTRNIFLKHPQQDKRLEEGSLGQ